MVAATWNRRRGCALFVGVFAWSLAALWVSAVGATEGPEGAEGAGDWLTIDRFLVPQAVLRAELSPAGTRVAYVQREAHGASLWILDASSGARRRLLSSSLVNDIAWSTDGGALFVTTARHVALVPLDPGARASWLVRLDPLREQALHSVDPSHPRHVLLTERTEEDRYRLLRVDAGGHVQEVLASDQPIVDFLLDDHGAVDVLKRRDGVEQVIVDRARGDRELVRCDVLDACGLMARDDRGRVLLKARLDEDRWRLVTIDPETGARETVHRDPEGIADLGPIENDPALGVPIVATYDTDRLHSYGLTPGIDAHVQHIDAELDGRNLAVQARASGRWWLVTETGPRLHHARHHLYDTRSRTLRLVLDDVVADQPTLPPARLADQRFVRYRGRDGMRLYGFVTRPSGSDVGSAPVVALVHGGPWAQVRSGFDPYVQFLADRGYVVFQPNFRASTGYGAAYMRAGKGQFGGGGAVQHDVLDGLRHLFDQGIGDPDRVAIVGHSFGGFSALAGVVFDADWFRAGIASAPPIDLVRALRDVEGGRTFLMPNGMPRTLLIAELLASLDDDEALVDIRRRSPETHVAETTRPLLMLAGALDDRVDVVDVKHYAAALDELGKDVSLLVDSQAGHGLGLPRARRAKLFLTERFLAHHLGGQSRPHHDPALAAYLGTTMLVRGESLEKALVGAWRPARAGNTVTGR